MDENRAPDPAVALARGLAVFPLPAGQKRPEPGWTRWCGVDPAEVAARWPLGANVGISCRTSGIVVLDLDRHPGKPDGVESFARACQQRRRPWPTTFTVISPTHNARGRGRHLYFRAPVGIVIGSTSGGVTALGPGIDTRGPGVRVGGHMVGPDSQFGGGRYEIECDVPIAALPLWIVGLLRLHSHVRHRVSADPRYLEPPEDL
jgi:hypothetical protein